MIIDSHVHLDMHRFKDMKKAAFQLIRDMEKAGIDRAIVLPDNLNNTNEHVKVACGLFPKRLYGFGMVNPKQTKAKIAKDIDKLMKNKWLKGIKLHPRTQNVNLDAPGVFHIARCIASRNLPLTIDCFPSFKYVDLDEKKLPNAFDKLAKRNPLTKIIMAHMGGHRIMDAYAVARSNPNVFLEVSYTFHHYRGSSVEGDMAFIIKKIAPKKIIYGSDHPSVDMGVGLKMFKSFCRKHRIRQELQKEMFGGAISGLIET